MFNSEDKNTYQVKQLVKEFYQLDKWDCTLLKAMYHWSQTAWAHHNPDDDMCIRLDNLQPWLELNSWEVLKYITVMYRLRFLANTIVIPPWVVMILRHYKSYGVDNPEDFLITLDTIGKRYKYLVLPHQVRFVIDKKLIDGLVENDVDKSWSSSTEPDIQYYLRRCDYVNAPTRLLHNLQYKKHFDIYGNYYDIASMVYLDCDVAPRIVDNWQTICKMLYDTNPSALPNLSKEGDPNPDALEPARSALQDRVHRWMLAPYDLQSPSNMDIREVTSAFDYWYDLAIKAQGISNSIFGNCTSRLENLRRFDLGSKRYIFVALNHAEGRVLKIMKHIS